MVETSIVCVNNTMDMYIYNYILVYIVCVCVYVRQFLGGLLSLFREFSPKDRDGRLHRIYIKYHFNL